LEAFVAACEDWLYSVKSAWKNFHCGFG
jgi:hypothetical protein